MILGLRIKLLLILLLSISTYSVQANELTFSEERGIKSNSFNLVLTTDIPSATIKYTLDSEWPNTATAQTYTQAIPISNTTVVRAIAYNSTDSSDVETHSYIYINDVLNQAAGLSIYPPDTEMDQAVVTDPQYSADIITGLQELVTVNVSLPEKHFIDGDSGIYANPFERGRDWERETSIEFIFPDGTHIQENMGMRVHGGASRGRDKKAFRVLFRSEYGEGTLKYPLFGPDADDSIDGMVLRCRGGQSWVHNSSAHRERAQLSRDQVARDLQGQMGHVISHGIQAHLYINGYYWGEYNIIEYFNQSFMSSYFGGDEDEYDIWNHSGPEEGDSMTWYNLHSYAGTAVTTQAVYDSISSIVDIENLAEYILLNFYAGNEDWDHNNWYSARRNSSDGKWRFFNWDCEQYFREEGLDVTSRNTPLAPSGLFNALMAWPDFRQLFYDKINCHMENNGIMTAAFIDSMWMAQYAILGKSIIAESARWGDNKRTPAYTLNVEFLNEQSRLRNIYFPNRNADVYNQLIASGHYSNAAAPISYSQLSSTVSPGFQLTLSDPNTSGTLYYTIDGSDPRAPGGGISPSAMTYAGPITINGITEVRARVKIGNDWGANCPQVYYTAQNYSDIVINEIHYNPSDSINPTDTIDGDRYEFIEIHNKGTQAVNLSGSYFKSAIQFTFPLGTIIPSGGFIVLAEDDEGYTNRYGLTAFAQFKGKLSNGGEIVDFYNPRNTIIDQVTYDDDLPWALDPDGSGPSLALTDPSLDNSLASSWAEQYIPVTPAEENKFCQPFTFNNNISDPQCFGINDGSATILLSNGNGPYTYGWSHGPVSNSVTNLAPGNYSLTVTDFYGCTDTESINIASPPTAIIVNAARTNPLCSGIDDGTLSASATGGSGGYSYSWSNGATTASISNLAPGSYTVTVTDSNGCQKSKTRNIAVPPAAITISSSTIDPLCAGINSGSASAQVTGGAGPFTYSWSNGATTASISNLAPGSYSLTASDSNGCTTTESYIINPPSNVLTVSSVDTDPSVLGAGDGSIVLNTNGPTVSTYTWSNGASTQSITGLSPGMYSVSISDINGCTTVYSTSISPGPQLPVAAATFSPNNGVAPINVSFNALGSSDPDGIIVGYSWDFGDGNTGTGVNPSHNFSNPGLYTVTLTVTDSQGLTDTITLNVNVIDNCNPPSNLSLITASSNTLIVNWQGDSDAVSYNLRYRDASIGGSWTNFPTSGTTAIITGLNDCTDYEVKVSNQCSFNLQSGFSTTQIFSTTNCFTCTAPLGLYQFNIQNISAIITWDVLVGATSYTYKFRKVGDANWISQTTTFPIAVLFGISGCTDYEWTMETTCFDGSTAQSSTINNFSTQCKTSSQSHSLVSDEIELYPNPVLDNLFLRIPYTSNESQIRILNQQGQLMKAIILDSKAEPIEQIIDVSDLSPGIYTLLFSDRAKVFVKL